MKNERKVPDKKVQNLPVGKVKVTVWPKKGGEITVNGKVMELSNGQRHLWELGNPGRSFGPGTKVIVIKRRKD